MLYKSLLVESWWVVIIKYLKQSTSVKLYKRFKNLIAKSLTFLVNWLSFMAFIMSVG